MHEFFVTVADSLGINENSDYENATEGAIDPVDEGAVINYCRDRGGSK